LTPEGGRHGEADDGNEGRNPAHDGGSIQESHQSVNDVAKLDAAAEAVLDAKSKDEVLKVLEQ